jgi:hypothetical protein
VALVTVAELIAALEALGPEALDLPVEAVDNWQGTAFDVAEVEVMPTEILGEHQERPAHVELYGGRDG